MAIRKQGRKRKPRLDLMVTWQTVSHTGNQQSQNKSPSGKLGGYSSGCQELNLYTLE